MASTSVRRSARLVSTSYASTFTLTTTTHQRNGAPNEIEDNPRPTKRARKTRVSSQADERAPECEEKPVDTTKKSSKRTKGPPPEPVPTNFPARTSNAWKVGPHVSSAGGVENAIVNAAIVGANAFAIFLKSQRRWDSPPLTSHSISSFKDRMKVFGYSPEHVLPHGSYLVNLGNPDETKCDKSFRCFLDDLKRCEQLGLHLYNFHPGSTVGQATIEESISLIASCINRAHKETEYVVVVLENMAGSGNVIGSRFSDLGSIIAQVQNKNRVGVCLDTCHMYAAGYDIRTKEGWEYTMAEFEQEVGFKYLRGMHLNDSKGALASKKDRHENIGLGELGLSTFMLILSDPRTKDIPLILETPAFDTPGSGGGLGATGGMDLWKTEVDVLNRLSTLSRDEDADKRSEKLKEWKREIDAVVKRASVSRDAKKLSKESTKIRREEKKTGVGRKRKVGIQEEVSVHESCSEDEV